MGNKGRMKMMMGFDWIDWLDRWFTPDADFFWAGVFVGFLFFCCVLFIDDEIQRRKDE